MEDIDTKIDVLLDMYKEDRTHGHLQSMTSSTADSCQQDDVTQQRLLQTSAIDCDGESSEWSSTRRSASELTSSSRQHQVKPMLRNLSDLGPRIKKRVTYSTRDTSSTLPAVTLDYKRPCHAEVLAQNKPSIVSEEDEELSGNVAVDDVKSSTSETSSPGVNGPGVISPGVISPGVNSQSDVQCLHRHTSDVTPDRQSDLDSNAQLYQLPTYQLTSCNTSLN